MRFCFASFALFSFFAVSARAADVEMPRVLDPRLKLELFAAEPDIVTPTGMGVDAKGRVLCIESHTHFRPKDYDGPPADRIRRFEDTDGDGRADRITTCFEGSTATMSVACHPSGDVYVATRNDVFKLRDADDDGVADENTPLVHLESQDNYPHSGIAGFTFADNGDVFFGLGENHAEQFKLKGTDGTVLTNLEGGHIYRMKSDGSKLERVMIGCWNPHASAVDDFGRLFTVDNDPDSLPPCRLLHVVPGADFGYKYRNGRRGTHPFTAWNGELPDTLPMVAGTGEAPSGILVCGRTSGKDKLPADYRGDLLVTSWGDHRIERYVLNPRGASVTAERTDVVRGGENFRPVGIVAGGDGAVYFSDWVSKDYNLHKKGRIWKLSVKNPLPKGEGAEKQPLAITKEEQRASSLRSATDKADAKTIWQACDDADPFIRQAAREGLKRIGAVTSNIDLKSLTEKQRLAALCVLRDLNTEEARSRLPELLSDSSPDIRLVALKWIGEEVVKSQRAALDRVLTSGPTTSQLFAAYLAAIEKLDRPPKKDNQEWTNEQYVVESLLNEKLPVEVRRWALRTLRPDHKEITSKRLREWLASSDEKLKLEAVRTLRESPIADREELLWEFVADRNSPADLCCEAIVGLTPSSPEATQRLLTLADDADLSVAAEALRSLRSATLSAEQLQQLEVSGKKRTALAELARRLTAPDTPSGAPETTNLDAWASRLEGPGDAAAGERIFFHPQSAGCAKCHQVDGRGGRIGPDLTVGARALDRRRLIESILLPSKEIAPQFTVWSLATEDGRTLTGILLGENAKEFTQIFGDTYGKTFTLKIADIESRTAQPHSIMPIGLEKLMTTQEFRDLLAFLQKRD
jgi:putative membrane-bound dehydrogenase-like protein